MPTPPAFLTARLFATRALTPGLQITILPETLAGSSVPMKQSSTCVGSAPVRPEVTESTSGAGPTGLATDAPLYVAPLPSVTEPRPLRLCVPAATVVSHGPGCATVPVVGPLLPAEAVTKTPASEA